MELTNQATPSTWAGVKEEPDDEEPVQRHMSVPEVAALAPRPTRSELGSDFGRVQVQIFTYREFGPKFTPPTGHISRISEILYGPV